MRFTLVFLTKDATLQKATGSQLSVQAVLKKNETYEVNTKPHWKIYSGLDGFFLQITLVMPQNSVKYRVDLEDCIIVLSRHTPTKILQQLPTF